MQATEVHDVVSQAALLAVIGGYHLCPQNVWDASYQSPRRRELTYDVVIFNVGSFVVDVCRLYQERTSILDSNINSYTSKVLDVEHQISRVVCLDFCTIDGCTYTSATIFPDLHANWKIILLFTIENG